MVIIDTNIIIDHLCLAIEKQTPSLLIQLVKNYPQTKLALSIISVQELYEGQSTKIKEREIELLRSIAPLAIVPYDYQVASLAGQIARDAKKPIRFADAAIAATAITNQANLFTLNTNDFKKIPALKLLPLKAT